MADPVVVFRTPSEIEASIVCGLLDAHGIHAAVVSDAPHAVFPLAVDGLGEVRVSVSAEDAGQAARLIADYRVGDGLNPGVRIRDEFDALEAAIGYRFRDRGLLEHALTHRSRAREDVTGGVFDNESLEFLGDAVLGFVVADLLFHRFPESDEGQKSKMKAALVSAPTLARRAERLQLGDHLLLGRGEEKTGGRRKHTLLADGYEALIAALHLDGGLDVARAFITAEFDALIGELATRGAQGDDSKSALQELLQAGGESLPEYVVTAEMGPAHRKLFHIELRVRGAVVAVAEGRTKKEAEQEAARLAIQHFTT